LRAAGEKILAFHERRLLIFNDFYAAMSLARLLCLTPRPMSPFSFIFLVTNRCQ
jgi:hypothetical protein